MKLGTEDRKKLGIAVVAGLGGLAAIVYAYGQLFPSIAAPVAQPATVGTSAPARAGTGNGSGGTSAKVVGTTAAALDPTLHMNAMLVTEALTYRGSGRNIFSANAAAPVSVPKPISSARPKTVAVAYTPPSGPPQPPPIDLRFFGTATRTGQPARAFLLRGEDVVLASIGDIVERRYKVLSIKASAVTVEDLTNERQQSLPLLAN